MAESMNTPGGPVVRWEGQKKKSVTFFESLRNPGGVFALILLFADLLLTVFASYRRGCPDWLRSVSALIFIHGLPLIVYAVSVLITYLKARRIYYRVTDEKIEVLGGKTDKALPCNEISYLTLRRGAFDRKGDTGDVGIYCSHLLDIDSEDPVIEECVLWIENIEDYEQVYFLLTDLSDGVYDGTPVKHTEGGNA